MRRRYQYRRLCSPCKGGIYDILAVTADSGEPNSVRVAPSSSDLPSVGTMLETLWVHLGRTEIAKRDNQSLSVFHRVS